MIRDRLARWEMEEEARDTAVLVVSELVTNAIVHAAGDRVVCEIREGGGRLRISVEDQGYGPTGPQLHDAAQDETEGEGGRGLFLVDSLCSGWGAHDTSGYGPGRVVWAELPHGELSRGKLSHGELSHGELSHGEPLHGELPHGTEQPC